MVVSNIFLCSSLFGEEEFSHFDGHRIFFKWGGFSTTKDVGCCKLKVDIFVGGRWRNGGKTYPATSAWRESIGNLTLPHVFQRDQQNSILVASTSSNPPNMTLSFQYMEL